MDLDGSVLVSGSFPHVSQQKCFITSETIERAGSIIVNFEVNSAVQGILPLYFLADYVNDQHCGFIVIP